MRRLSADLTPRDRAQRAFSVVLQRMARGRAGLLAEEMNVSDSTLSELKNKHLEKALLLLANLGLKVVDVRAKCLSPTAYQFLVESHERMTRHAPQLVWGDDESVSNVNSSTGGWHDSEISDRAPT